MSDNVPVPPVESFKELKERLKAEGQTKEQVMAEQGGIDLDNLPTVTHNFVRRGVVVSCEGAGHPNHRHFLVSK